MKRFQLDNISCAACSLKIESALQRLPDFPPIRFDHLTGLVTTATDIDRERLEKAVRRIDGRVRVRPAGAAPRSAVDRRTLATIIAAGLLMPMIALLEERLSGQGLTGLVVAGYAIAYLTVGLPVLRRTFQALRGLDLFNEYFLMSLATLGAIVIGSFPEAVSVMLFFRIGELVESRALARSKTSIDALLAAQPEQAVVLRHGRRETVSPSAVMIGETIFIRSGEKVPLDGIILQGRSSIDCASLTGESLPIRVGKGKKVPAGAINLGGVLKVRVEKLADDSSIARVLALVRSAAEKKSGTERFITRFARVYTPVVVLLALVLAFLPPLVAAGEALGDWVYRALVLLVISCPCALVISIPLGYFGGIGAAARHGILVKGSVFLDRLLELETVAFDKTGTLTEGRLGLSGVFPTPGVSRRRLLRQAALAEAHSRHPIAETIRRAAGKENDATRIDTCREIAGMGVLAMFPGGRIVAGSTRLLRRERIACPPGDDPGIVVHVARDGRYLGRLVIGDRIRPGAGAAIAALKRRGVKRIVMLSGDNPASANRTAARLGLGEVRAGLLPADKVRELERLMAESAGTTAFVGDGTNDAPVLARADLGVALGGIGSDAAIETADLVILGEDPGKLAEAIGIARRTRRVVRQNITLAFGVKAAFVAGAALGIPSLWEAVFADVGVALLAIGNASRLVRTR